MHSVGWWKCNTLFFSIFISRVLYYDKKVNSSEDFPHIDLMSLLKSNQPIIGDF